VVRFTLLLQLPLKTILNFKNVEIDSEIIISLFKSKSMTHSAWYLIFYLLEWKLNEKQRTNLLQIQRRMHTDTFSGIYRNLFPCNKKEVLGYVRLCVCVCVCACACSKIKNSKRYKKHKLKLFTSLQVFESLSISLSYLWLISPNFYVQLLHVQMSKAQRDWHLDWIFCSFGICMCKSFA